MRAIALMVVFLTLSLNTQITFAKPGQKIPDLKRQQEIRTALQAHGYSPGRTWPETLAVLKQVAREHFWQSNHAPDARVLILLGLGNKNSDPDVLSYPPSRLESVVQK